MNDRERLNDTERAALIKLAAKTTFNEHLETFVNGCQMISDKHMERYPRLEKPVITYTEGKRYVKLARDGSVHCFVDMTNGDVLKAAGWNKPAKHARGNIFDDHNGLRWMGEYGPAYLKQGRRKSK